MRAYRTWILAAVLSACAHRAPAPDAPAAAATRQLSIVALSDFHGWLSPLIPNGGKGQRYYGGLANLRAQLAEVEKLTEDNSLILDNGDMWTGPIASTLLAGAPVVAAYNALGVDAANVANHEFDFGPAALAQRAAEARFPFLGANIFLAGTNDHPAYIKPWVILKRGGFRVGVLGLSYVGTPQTTHAHNIEGLEFRGYAETLQRELPALKKAGAEAIVVLFHDEVQEVQRILAGGKFDAISLVVAGQNHRKSLEMVGRIPVVNPGPFGRSYARFDLSASAGAAPEVRVAIKDVAGDLSARAYAPDPELTEIVHGAEAEARRRADTVLGQVDGPLPVGTFEESPLGHLVVDAWLEYLPQADVAMLNHGAIRQPLGRGAVTVGALRSVLPFENNIFLVSLTGAQIKAQLAINEPVVGGISWQYRQEQGQRRVLTVVDRSGRPLQDNRRYRVAILDFMYHGGDGFTFREFDKSPEDTGISWRQPVVAALQDAHESERALNPTSGPRSEAIP